MFSFSHGKGHRHPRFGAGRGRPEMDVERFFHWVERLNDGEHRRHGGGGGGGGGRRGRMFDGEELRLLLLKLIADEARHGYELIKAIETMTGGSYAPSPGVVYPSLTMLNDMELIEERPGNGARKRFGVTPAGEAHLAEHGEQVAALIARLTGLNDHHHRADQAPVRRAMANLRHAVQDRLFRGEPDEDTAHAIAAVIDEAVQKIERLK